MMSTSESINKFGYVLRPACRQAGDEARIGNVVVERLSYEYRKPNPQRYELRQPHQ
jgi:hypothetical protein